jgi:hypothetical protein
VKHWGYIAIGVAIWWGWLYLDGASASTDSSSSASSTDSAASTGLGSSFLDSWSHAIAGFENVNPAYNNPGGLNTKNADAGYVPAAGGTGHDVIGVYSTLDAGYTALKNTLSHFKARYGGQSLLDATAIYVLGPNSTAVQTGNYPDNVVNEAQYVADQMGVSVNSTLNDLGSSE